MQTKAAKILNLICLILVTLVIFVLAAMPGEKSSKESSSFTVFVNNFLSLFTKKETSEIKVNSIDLGNDLVLTMGEEITLQPKILPENAMDKNVYYVIDNENIANVNSNGVVTPKTEGETTIKCISSRYNEISDEIKITVNPVLLTSFDVDETSLSLYLEETGFLRFNYVPSNSTRKGYSLEPLDDGIEVVRNNLLKGKRAGTSKIKLTSTKDTSITRTLDIEVKENPNHKLLTSVNVCKDQTLLVGTGFDSYIEFDNTITDTNLYIENENSNLLYAAYSNSLNLLRVNALKEGIAHFNIVYANDPSIRQRVEIIIEKVKVTSLTINKPSSFLRVGDSFDFSATINPTDATYKNVIWSTNNDNAIISSTGHLTALKKGKIEVTATSCDDETIKTSITIEIKKVSFFSKEALKSVEHFLRKAVGHFSLFGVLGYFTIMYCFTFMQLKKKVNTKNVLIASASSLGYCFIIGCLSEFFQSLTDARGPSFKDVLLDTAGSLSFIVICMVVIFLVYKTKKEKEKQ